MKRIGVVSPGAELITPPSVTVEFGFGHQKSVPEPVALNADRRIGGVIVPLVPAAKGTVNVCKPPMPLAVRSSLKLIALAELTAAGWVFRLPRLILIGPV